MSISVFLPEMPTETRDKMREWYNGYSWNGRDFVYNTFSVLNFFASGEYHNYWFSTAAPTFLVKRLNREVKEALIRALSQKTKGKRPTPPALTDCSYLC